MNDSVTHILWDAKHEDTGKQRKWQTENVDVNNRVIKKSCTVHNEMAETPF